MAVSIGWENVALNDGGIAYRSNGRNEDIVFSETRSRVSIVLQSAYLQCVTQRKSIVLDAFRRQISYAALLYLLW
jgi:hypothetical protein